MNKEIKDMLASVRTRLTEIAKDTAVVRNLDSIVLNYMQERFLYRLSVSAHVGILCLRADFFFIVFMGLKHAT